MLHVVCRHHRHFLADLFTDKNLKKSIQAILAQELSEAATIKRRRKPGDGSAVTAEEPAVSVS